MFSMPTIPGPTSSREKLNGDMKMGSTRVTEMFAAVFVLLFTMIGKAPREASAEFSP